MDSGRRVDERLGHVVAELASLKNLFLLATWDNQPPTRPQTQTKDAPE
jgi:hypothetical protein